MEMREKVAGVIRDRGQTFVNDWETNDDQFRHEACKNMAAAIDALYAEDRRLALEALDMAVAPVDVGGGRREAASLLVERVKKAEQDRRVLVEALESAYRMGVAHGVRGSKAVMTPPEQRSFFEAGCGLDAALAKAEEAGK